MSDNMKIWVLESNDDNPDIPSIIPLGYFKTKPTTETLIKYFNDEGLTMGREDNNDILFILNAFATLSRLDRVKCNGVIYSIYQVEVHP